MRLRELQKKDVPYMLEWMHDYEVVKDLKSNFQAMQIKDCENFIDFANSSNTDIHKAIVDETDEYMGTVSLKHIKNNTAEFAIAIRKIAMGYGFASYAMNEIIQYGFQEKGLQIIYWCVDRNNKRACRFYDKNGYKKIKVEEEMSVQSVIYNNYEETQIKKYFWYAKKA